MLRKLGILFTEKVKDAGAGDRGLAGAAGRGAGEPARAGRAQEALPAAEGLGRAREVLRGAGQVRRVHPRARAPGRDRRTTPRSVVLVNKIAELYRDRLHKADRAKRAYEKVLSLDAQEPRRPPRRSSRSTRRRKDVAQARRGAARPARAHDRIRPSGRRACSGSPSCSRRGAGDKRGALRMALQAFAEDPRDDVGHATSSRLARRERAAGPSWSRPTRRRCRKLRATRRRCRCCWRRWRAAYETELAEPRGGASHATRRSSSSRPRTREAVDALERLYLATGRFAELLAIYDKKLELAKTKDEQLEIRFKLAGLYEDEIKHRDKAIELYQAILKQDPDEPPALRALDRIYQRLGQWKELAATIERGDRRCRHRTRRAIVELKFRLGAMHEQHLDDGAGAVDSYRDALDARADARRRARPRCRPTSRATTPSCSMAAVEVLEPIYEQTDECARLVEVQRIQLAHEKKTDERGSSLLLRIGELRRPAGRTPTRRSTPTRAPSARTRRRRRRARRWRTWPPSSTTGSRWSTLYEKALSAKGKEKLAAGAGARAPAGGRRRVRREAGEVGEGGRVLPARAEHPARGCLGAGGAGAALHAHRALERSRRHAAARRRSWSATPAEREEIRIRIATVWEEMLGNAERGDRRLERRARRTTPRNVRALRALDRLYLARGEFRELADNLQRQLTLTEDEPARRSRCSVRLGALREQQLGEVGAAVDTYRQVLELEPEHAETIAALERILPNPEHELRRRAAARADLQDRAATGRSLIGVYEIEARHAVDPEQKIALLPADRRAATRSASTIRRAPTTRSAARWARIR